MATASAQTLERAKLAWRRSPLPGFLRWWGGELTAMLPAGLRAWVRRGPDVLWLGEAGGNATIRRARTGAMLAAIGPELPVDVQRTEFARACAG
ncbi:MAG TPA: fimbrial assembly protein, partial [Rhodanobacteraceae bacterium]|nr:fimbrial assembly protein [Rhodanobacteraceae bacterium]